METFARLDEESGFHLLLTTSKEIVDRMKTFKVRDDDVWVITYPKSGTTWMQEIVSAVCADGDLETINKTSLTERVPFIDCVFPFDKRPPYIDLEEMTSRRLIKTHFPHQLIPPGVLKQTPKVIYVARNPKDVIVSCFYFFNGFISEPKLKWDEFFQLFIKDEVPYGSWFNHNLYWWNRRHEAHVLFVTYEDMKKDLSNIVHQVSEFLGHVLNEETVARIVDHCSFSSMKKNPKVNKSEDVMLDSADSSGKNIQFMRKGIVGEWKTHFTVAQCEQLDKLYKKRLQGTDLTLDVFF
ncbi:sulfotransferase 1C2-like isoform X2 [Anneissia japonica]|nr:sulfotransferase 1C2-like isoform X2 [Anneissia japonica]XP_033126742.1 sulfotransferase 1C2-like isoform X2 [Anneissia japonica]XP_033126743.1 sulfotransferase 1C2-like isoform X2 [Anneissia japonica]